MKAKLFFLIIALCGTFMFPSTVHAQAAPFAYPSIPDSITNFQARSDYYVSHFWDRIDLKRAFSSKERVAKAFADYVAPMRLASADTVFASVGRFMHALEKQPKDLVYVAELAENNLYCDTAQLPSDELYLAFIRPMLDNKRVDKTAKLRYAAHAAQLDGALTGKPIGELTFTSREGRHIRFLPRKGQAVIIYFNDPECDDCTITRIRLMADARAKELIDNGNMAIVALTPSEPDDEWRRYAATYPDNWLVGADPDLDLKLDLRGGTPSFYVVDENGILIAKHLKIDAILSLLSRI